ncbi:MAG: hypothetical protein HN855_03595 [Anaerolineae bacterium]|jgi:hypothetical protein|nr:hypothetical protein [Anaerolineae bacterium]MBT7070325.1 hypothetical protein [Anaerolineae bacterium]MBT7324220.1 hypothetical protein [Anaerolineae bacterium]
MIKSKFLFQFGLVALGVVTFLIALCNRIAQQDLIYFIETYLAHEGKITNFGYFTIKISFILIYFYALWIFLYKKDIYQTLKLSYASQKSVATKFFSLLISTLFIIWLFFKESRFFYYEGVLEYLTFIFFTLSMIILVITLRTKKLKKTLIYPLSLIALSFFFWGMEEISWGQTLLNWKTPEFFMKMSFQGETNFHNFLNPLFPPFYAFFSLSLGYFLLYSNDIKSFLEKNNFLSQFTPIIPNNEEYALWGVLFLLLSVLSIFEYELVLELIEELFSVYCLVYAIFVFQKAPSLVRSE